MSAAETSRPGEARTEREIAQALRLRSDPPRVMRLSRKVLIGLGVVAGLGVGLELGSNNESDIAAPSARAVRTRSGAPARRSCAISSPSSRRSRPGPASRCA